jgi:uncharacterized membrane protein YqiK
MNLLSVLLIVALAIGLLAFLSFTLFYRRADKQTSIVRTGLGGESVIMSSGLMVVPLLHKLIKINMKTIEVPVSRIGADSITTKAHLRVDAKVNFFLRVETTKNDISLAAQTMGNHTFDDAKMLDMFEERCEAALVAVVNKMTLDELHTNKEHFRDDVENFIRNDLASNGLILQSVALKYVNQTATEFFNEQNIFDSQGLTRIKEQIAKDARDQAEAKSKREIEIRELEYEAEANSIDFEKKLVEEQEEKRREINEIQQKTERDIAQARITKERDIELFQQRKSMLIAEGQKKVAEIWIETDKLKAVAAKTSEEVTTARETAQAERSRTVEIIGTEKEADRQRIIAQASADAEKVAAEAAAVRYQVEATGKNKLNQAANTLSNEQIDMQVKMNIVKQLPSIVKESVKPLENIEGIKIIQLDGLNNAIGGGGNGRNGGGGNGGGNGGGGSLSDQIVDSALRYKAQAPLVDNLLKEIGIDGSSMTSLSEALKDSTSTAKAKIEKKDDTTDGDIKKSA